MKTPSPLRHTVIAAIIAVSSSAALADDPKLPPPQKDMLQAVLDRIRQHAAGEAWKQPGFKDDAIEAWLDKLLGSIAKATDIADLKLPVRFKDLGNAPPNRRSQLQGALVIGKDIDLRNFSIVDSIILADGTAVLGSIQNSVVVARQLIVINSYSTNCVFATGIGFRGGEYDGDGQAAGSVVVSRGWADLGGQARGTIVAAHEGVAAGEISNVTFVNAPVPPPGALRGRGGFGVGALAAPRDNGSKSVRVPDLPLETMPIHPQAAKFKVLGILHTMVKPPPGALIARRELPGVKPTGIVLQHEGRRYIVDLNQPLLDEAGAPVAGFSDYRLVEINGQFALFSKPDVDLVLPIGSK